ncbi:MAG TPA: hypothetical protein VJZ49_05655 [Syntrophales bacterium]|nr:hypothetical protein [Syntrophales bacterium]
MNNAYTISPISNGQYHVRIHLDKWMNIEQIRDLQARYDVFHKEDPHFWKVCKLYGDVLCYKSETLFPFAKALTTKKKKVLMVLGNPATHSVAKGMFFFSMGNEENGSEEPHNFWIRLEKAGLIEELWHQSLEEAARTRKWLIQTGLLSQDYLFGLTTFYSFPTPGMRKYKHNNIEGVGYFFGPAIQFVEQMEYERLNSYIKSCSFLSKAVIVCRGKEADKSINNWSKKYIIPNKITKPWPVSGNNCGGDYLRQILESA